MCVCVRNNLVKLMWILKCFGIWVCIFFHCCICVMRNMCNHSQSAATLNSFILFVRNCKTTEELPISTEETELNPEQNLFLLDNNWWVLTAVFLVSAFPFIKLPVPPYIHNTPPPFGNTIIQPSWVLSPVLRSLYNTRQGRCLWWLRFSMKPSETGALSPSSSGFDELRESEAAGCTDNEEWL